MNIFQNCLCTFTLRVFIGIDRIRFEALHRWLFPSKLLFFLSKWLKFIVKIQSAQIPLLKKLKIWSSNILSLSY